MPPTRYAELLGLLETGAVEPGRLVRRELSLADVPARLAAMTEYETAGVEVVTSFRERLSHATGSPVDRRPRYPGE